MIANLQEQFCNNPAICIPANGWRMDDLRQQAIEMLDFLTNASGDSLSQIAAKSGLAVSTLTRFYNTPVKHQLSGPTLAKIRRAYAEYFERSDAPDEIGTPDYLPVEVLPTFAGMGGGGTGDGDDGHALLPRALIEDQLRAKSTDLLLIDVRGNSMEPDFQHGDQILVDKRDRNPLQPGPFALWDGDGYLVKNVERVPGKRGVYRVFSNNSRFTDAEYDETAVQIMGRPVWFARRL